MAALLPDCAAPGGPRHRGGGHALVHVCWNEYTYTVIFTRSPSNYTVPLALSVLNTEDNLTNFGLVAAGGVISVIPITLFVIFAQNYLISGLSSGAVKE